MNNSSPTSFCGACRALNNIPLTTSMQLDSWLANTPGTTLEREGRERGERGGEGGERERGRERGRERDMKWERERE